ncbi:hypothetical protein [Embleya sp. NBC_00896]|uniref:hypothetical protein n=1 Tax=Embleya sp. NBC_00896 TaxID=2975961 RepID=UPI00386C3CBE|nr:hypothetical protein OG928_11690 [Embleya sp. NBC_00896]
MTRTEYDADMTRGATVLRCVADFIGCRPALPPVTSVDVGWSQVDLVWSVKIHMYAGTSQDMERWALAMDDVVTTRVEATSEYIGEHTRIEVAGTIHGHSVTVWTTLDGSTR